MKPKQYIGLIDCNNFFVSCERLFRPDLKKRPVVVLSSNDGCVVARSEEIKDMGIAMGVPYFQIKDILNEVKAEVFSSHFSLYRDISSRVFNVVRESFSEIEQYSIDECFFSFDEGDPIEVAKNLKRSVEEAVGMPVSIGIAPSKTLAKLASRQAKVKGGVFYASPEFCTSDLLTIPLGMVWGVGRNRATAFREAGLVTVGDLLSVPASLVGSKFGVEGVRTQSELSGRSVHQIVHSRPLQKSFMSTRSFAKTSNEEVVVKDAVLYHLNNCVKDLKGSGACAGTVRLLLGTSWYGEFGGKSSSVEVVLSVPSDNLLALQEVVLDLFSKAFRPDIPYKKAGVVFGGVVEKNALTSTLFASKDEKKQELVADVIGQLQKRFGQSALTLGRAGTYERVWSSKHEALSPAYTTRWGDLRIVKAK